MARKRRLLGDVEKLPPEAVAPVSEIVKALGVAADQWDVVLVGDGSGVSWDIGCGWATVLIDHYEGYRKLFVGAIDPGNVHLAELMAYFHAMMWYSRDTGLKRLNRLRGGGSTGQPIRPDARVNVHVITDNETVAKQGQLKYSRKANAEIWTALDFLCRPGFKMFWHWVRRDTIGLNKLVDALAGRARKAVEAVAAVRPPAGTTIYDFNPEVSRDPAPQGELRPDQEPGK